MLSCCRSHADVLDGAGVRVHGFIALPSSLRSRTPKSEKSTTIAIATIIIRIITIGTIIIPTIVITTIIIRIITIAIITIGTTVIIENPQTPVRR